MTVGCGNRAAAACARRGSGWTHKYSTTDRSYLGKWSKSSNRLEVRRARRPNKRSKMANIVVDDFVCLCRLVSNVVYFNKCVFIAVLQSSLLQDTISCDKVKTPVNFQRDDDDLDVRALCRRRCLLWRNLSQKAVEGWCYFLQRRWRWRLGFTSGASPALSFLT